MPVIEGEVAPGSQQDRACWISIDDEIGSTVRAWQVNEGDVIRARVSRIFRTRVRSADDQPPREADMEPPLPSAVAERGERNCRSGRRSPVPGLTARVSGSRPTATFT